jgi:hypothetical protein
MSMRTTTGSRKLPLPIVHVNILIFGSWAFPPAEQDLKEGDQDNKGEQVEGSDKAKEVEVVGAKETAVGGSSGNISGVHATVDDLPEVPKAEPSTGGEPGAKRQKQQPSDS